MRAVQYDAVGGPVAWREVPEPACPTTGAVIEVKATGVCRSDWHAWRGHDPVPLPMTPGHEFAGLVAAVGPAVTRFKVGDRVTAPFVNGCGVCAYCQAGQAQVCPDQTQPGFTHPGSFAQRVVVRQADFNLVTLPAEMDFVTAAALGCRFATSFHALTAQAGLAAGEWLAVFGAGGVGLAAVLIAKAQGAKVVAVDRSGAALERAAGLGADHVIKLESPGGPAADRAALETAAAKIRGDLDGGAHVALDAVGSEATAWASVRSLRRRGRQVQVGLMLGQAAEAALPWGLVVAQELRVAGSHGMAAADYPAMLDLIIQGKLDPTRLVGQVIGFEALGEALMAMDAPVLGTGGLTVAAAGSA
ncbi:MAG: alcohol dehydrogenase catalytic domain-containing protein [Bifidobacteriaceae bacterium]|jgi:alcohol dehydrogenase|nr:alcohol dehydrogenase catalytic domain-containing protein [Bifidobacteriaceae bacterium]